MLAARFDPATNSSEGANHLMDYTKTVPFTGRASRALDVARTTFMSQGFQIVASTDQELRVVGAGMNSTRENALKGVSEATLIVRPSAIEVQARLGGAERMKKFLTFFPMGMAVLFLIVFGVLAFVVEIPAFRRPLIFLIPLLALSPWIFLAPMMSRMVVRRTTQAVDDLLNNMVL